LGLLRGYVFVDVEAPSSGCQSPLPSASSSRPVRRRHSTGSVFSSDTQHSDLARAIQTVEDSGLGFTYCFDLSNSPVNAFDHSSNPPLLKHVDIGNASCKQALFLLSMLALIKKSAYPLSLNSHLPTFSIHPPALEASTCGQLSSANSAVIFYTENTDLL
jgi:hypothetical protein